MKLIVKYFGMITEWTGTHENEIDFSGSTVADLKSQLEVSCSELNDISYQVAVNHRVSDNDLALNESDELAILPPFSGG
jgi:molybdopterin synthase sulfur carrier subunit